MLPISTRTSSALRPLPVSRLERRKLWRNTNSSVSSFEFLYTYDLPAPCKERVSVGSRLHFRRARSASKPSNSGSWSWPFWNQSIPSIKGYLHGSWVMKSLVQYEHSFANPKTSNNSLFNPDAGHHEVLEEDDRNHRNSSGAYTASSSRRSSNRRQPWIDARKL